MIRKWMIFAVFVAMLMCAGCSILGKNDLPNEPTAEPQISETPVAETTFVVAFYADEEKYDFSGESVAVVNRGEDAVFTLKMKNDYRVDRVTWAGDEIDAEIVNENGIAIITIKDIHFSIAVKAECTFAGTYIAYYPNGGTYLNGDDPKEPYYVGYSIKNRLRPNTEIGFGKIERKGWVQLGWNTKPNGDGEHIGLGSRATVVREGTTNLYAEWVKESDVSEFEFEKVGEEWKITKYIGNNETVVIPGTLDLKNITTIGEDAFADSDVIKTVVLSSNIKTIEDGAFRDSALNELYLFDNIEYISDRCFEGCGEFSNVHINAHDAPRCARFLYSEYNFADKYDILILHKDEKKVVLFGGSGAYFSVDPKKMETDLSANGEDYVCIDMAVNGWFNGPAQFEMIMPYLKEGDVFVHIPESSSCFSVMYLTTMAPQIEGFDYNQVRLYCCVESNYDLFSLVDLRTVEDFFDGFREFLKHRKTLFVGAYTDYKTKIAWYSESFENDLGYIDDRGGIAFPLKANYSTESGEGDIVVEYITDETAHNRLNSFYDRMESNGVKVMFTTAPVNIVTLKNRLYKVQDFNTISVGGAYYYGRVPGIPDPDYPDLDTWVAEYEKAVENNLHCTVILPLHETIYEMDAYCEPDYHLADPAKNEYTDKITNGLLKQLKP